ncbi:uncharacterized protein FOMMEDRAFT_138636 [Fomitiporia mediterranea MF3/22]|uniref:uncharacterized protein n=1 Tax=Fomitiporia mediterranea (strain MF3/22) TaxID=694068 RepID=UPI0004409C6E|nr:uncharacterized protein FOMMEDRAFT_138636 [Fomitiporia mediterranea MF3/22]EJD06832.1 hypothetical protein FOMMEDRAFT_138636 [Fomitiporia mediterranea MF3/22]
MHSTRDASSTHLSSLSIVLPRPPLPKRASSIRLSNDSVPSPRTPRSSLGLPSPTLLKLDSAVPRRSTDSWNSSVHDGGDDDMEWEWTFEQLALLKKTLDALPSHLLTPFNGSIPPANILDRVSRSIVHAKGPVEWPHSVRSTRIKLIKLARSRVAEDAVIEEDPADYIVDVLQPTTNVPKKPLYRQSSMDFLKGKSLKNEKNIDLLSSRLQKVDRMIPNPARAYDRNSSQTPPPSRRRPLSVGESPGTPRTPRSDDSPQLYPPSSLSGSRGSKLRRSTTVLTGLPTIPSGVATDCIMADKTAVPRVPKVKRSESFSSPNFNGLGHSLKRAPSYGSVSSRMSIDDDKENSPEFAAINAALDIYPSSDDEEKARDHKIKKQKTTGTLSADHTQQAKKSKGLPKTASAATIKANGTPTPKKDARSRKSSAKKIQRTSSMFGAELPNPQPEPAPPAAHIQVPTPEDSVMLTDENIDLPPVTPHRRLRRVKTTNFPLRVKRRISFGHLSAPAEGAESAQTDSVLGSAIQLR